MKSRHLLLLITCAGLTPAQEKKNFSFDNLAPGGLPPGWKVDATNPKGELAEWKVAADPEAPSKPNVLSITKIRDTSQGVFNLCWSPAVVFKDGVIEVKMRADTGEADQGGGLIWRAKDGRNYYIARYNPLERNFRLYFVKDGIRKMLRDAPNLDIKAREWFTIRIVHRAGRIEAWLNGKKLLEATDDTIAGAGGVGLWSKADAASSFDDFTVQPDARKESGQ